MHLHKNIALLSLVASAFLLSGNCDKNEDMHDPNEPDYHVHIHAPDGTDKHAGQSLEIEVEFEDHNGGIVHHINVRIYNPTSGEEIYNAPSEPHVHSSMSYTQSDEITLDVDPNTDWILVGSVWGHEDDAAVTRDSIQFHVIP
jgi:hypothetical protein